MTPTQLEVQARILAQFQSWIGVKEITPNRGFQNPAFEKTMRLEGWQPPQAYCAYTVKAGYRRTIPRDLWAHLSMLMTAGAMQTYQNLKAAYPNAIVRNASVTPGSLVFWRLFENNTASWKGHTGVVEKVVKVDAQLRIHLQTIEGNTATRSLDPSGRMRRDGDGVYRMYPVTDTGTKTGLRFVGFFDPFKGGLIV